LVSKGETTRRTTCAPLLKRPADAAFEIRFVATNDTGRLAGAKKKHEASASIVRSTVV
jgi:hypothetical protein